MADVTLYTTEPCPYCRNAKALLQKRGIAYEEISMARDAEGRAALVERTGMMTFPQIVIGDEVVGGFTELAQADRDGRLAQLVAG